MLLKNKVAVIYADGGASAAVSPAPSDARGAKGDALDQQAVEVCTTSAPLTLQVIYLTGREPLMRISTSRLALCCQSGLDATFDTPIRARSRSIGSRSLRMSPLLMARFTSARIASQIRL